MTEDKQDNRVNMPVEVRKRAKRNPQARRQAIIEATARLLLQEKPARVTHRRIAEAAGVPLGSTTQYFSDIDELRRAGYELLSQQLEDDYVEMFQGIEASGGDVEALAQVLCSYLEDSEEARADMALYSAAAQDPNLRALVRKSDRLFIEGLLPYMDEARARAIAVFVDGLVVQRSLYDTAFDRAFVTEAFRSLIASGGFGAGEPTDAEQEEKTSDGQQEGEFNDRY